jgi:hypothetical protein
MRAIPPAAAGPARRRSPAVRYAACVALFLVSGLAFAAFAPRRDIGLMGGKLREFHETGPYDVAFVGCSWTEFHISPEVFDAASVLRSYNLGLRGAMQAETSYLLERLAERPNGLRYVVMDVVPWTDGIRPSDLLDPRAIQWHDPRRTRLSAGKALAAGRRDGLRDHLTAFALRFFRVGVGLSPAESDGARGFVEIDDILLNVRGYLIRLDLYRRGELERRIHDEVDVAELERNAAMLRAAGVQPLMLVQPILDFAAEKQLARELAAQGRVGPLLDFGNPDVHPELFRTEYRVDPEHLNAEGAVVYSELLGREFRRRLGDA